MPCVNMAVEDKTISGFEYFKWERVVCVCVMKRGWCKCETHLGEGSHSEGSGVAQHLPPRTSPMKNNSISVLLAVSI